jgi:cullin-4
MKREDLHRVLKTLCSASVRILRVSKEHKLFSFNKTFSLKLFRIKLTSWLGSKEAKQKRDATNEKVWESRQYQIDACLVRFVFERFDKNIDIFSNMNARTQVRMMKTRKTLKHNDLVAECARLVKFPVEPIRIKKRIESLLDREYIKRDDSDSSTYHYIS